MIVAFLYVGIYLLLSIPSVQNVVRKKAEKAVSTYLKSDVKIGSLDIHPFNEVRLSDVVIYTPKKEKCISIETLGAGIHLWRLIYDKKIEITYAEIIGLDGNVWQQKKNDPLNIQFIIDAFKPKDKNKPPTKFDLKLHNIVIRRSSLSFSRRWVPADGNPQKMDFNHLKINDLKADITLPQIKNDDFLIDIRRLSFVEKSGFTLEKLSLLTHITPRSISTRNLVIKLPDTEIRPSDISFSFSSFREIKEALSVGNHNIELVGNRITPEDFKAFLPVLGRLKNTFVLDLSLSGNLTSIKLNNLLLRDDDNNLSLGLESEISNVTDTKEREISLESFSLLTKGSYVNDLISTFSTKLPGESISQKIAGLGRIEVSAEGAVSFFNKNGEVEAMVKTDAGKLSVVSDLNWSDSRNFLADLDLSAEELDLQSVTGNGKLGSASFSGNAEIRVSGKEIDGDAEVDIEYVDFNGYRLQNLVAKANKKGKDLHAEVDMDDKEISLTSTADILLAADKSELYAFADIRRFNPSIFNIPAKYRGYIFSGKAEASLKGNNIDNVTGFARAESLSFLSEESKGMNIRKIEVRSENEQNIKKYIIDSDFLRGSLEGNFRFKDLVASVTEAVQSAIPDLVASRQTQKIHSFDKPANLLRPVNPVFPGVSLPHEVSPGSEPKSASWNFRILPDDEVFSFFSVPFKPLADVEISGNLNIEDSKGRINVEAPFLLQGKSKVIRNVSLKGNLGAAFGINADLLLNMPVKNDDADVKIKLNAFNNNVTTDVAWQLVKDKSAVGKVDLTSTITRNPFSKTPDIALTILPSTFKINGAEWKIDKASVSYMNNVADVRDLRIWHNDQFVDIEGTASSSKYDEIKVSLADIDLSYIFNTLNINYVTFGGFATGEFSASNLFSKIPVLKTNHLFIKDMSYNGSILGDGNLESHWDSEKKMVAINADIRERDGKGAKVYGGVYVTRDSLSFIMDADKVNIGFLKPFMSGFTSDVGGRASGRAKLYGTFKDIDLVGNIYADSISIKVDQTNVYYHGSDSVIMTSGLINIPSFTLHDKFGHTANFGGYLKHDYFHRPEFEFKINGARNLLAFDTNPKINPDWYGTIFVNGNGVLRGRPGLVSLQMDVSTAANSTFTFVLSETQTAADYTFLTFSDKRKEKLEEIEGEVDLEEIKKKVQAPIIEKPTLFTMNLRGDITKATKVVIVMDPVAGDKIVAYGSGPLQVAYDTDSDEMMVYGKYTLDEGNYNFSLQDLILRDFKINSGSSISFNGDPLQGILDIKAAYRVNTNLSDLDKSFSTDRDLNRTNVPVDAILQVNGDMRSPEISFDISLPTLTSDVERKVKSIISTDDMLNRQIIYLLALNRFYTPEYMNTSGSGNELASVASSTLSSQLTNIVGQLTDKLTVAPSFRSDKGDFSDMEVDLALSSRLLNNRLLINGNFGYRDRTTSTTTFVGDFDIEYLLSKNGDLRLKAYNHFNDQNYYLKSSLTTQGIGVIYRHDFNNPFSFLKRKKRRKDVNKEETVKQNPDSVKVSNKSK